MRTVTCDSNSGWLLLCFILFSLAVGYCDRAEHVVDDQHLKEIDQ